jgi:hypothetical protein
MRQWLSSASVGPFFVLEHPVVDDPHYRGESTRLDISLGLAQIGAMQLELIEQHSAGPSVYRDSIPVGSSGLHHVGGFTDNLDAEYERYALAGAEVAYEGRSGDMRFAYFDTRAAIGCMTEYLERKASTEAMFATIAEASVDWDGRDPIRAV